MFVGNTVHYKVELETVSEAKYPKCSFTISGTQPGRLVGYFWQQITINSSKCSYLVIASWRSPYWFHRFETGYAVLNAVLSEATPISISLPLPRLWTLLITVACQHKGAERIKVVRLLQEIVNRQVAAAESADLQSGAPSKMAKLELSALKPLWQLYTTLVKEYGKWSSPLCSLKWDGPLNLTPS